MNFHRTYQVECVNALLKLMNEIGVKITLNTTINKFILKNKYATLKQLDEIDVKIRERVNECEKFADDSPYPEKNIMYDAVYEEKNYPFLKHKLI